MNQAAAVEDIFLAWGEKGSKELMVLVLVDTDKDEERDIR